MCAFLKISRGIYYYTLKNKILNPKNNTEELYETDVVNAFKNSYKIYGTRKIRERLQENNIVISRRRISRIMKKRGLVSVYTKAKYKPNKKEQPNNAETENILDRNFSDQEPNHALVSDLTYVRVLRSWHYICILLDLYNREIVSYSVGPKKDADLVVDTFQKASINLKKVELFHTDRGSEFKNIKIDEQLDFYKIKRSLSHKGCPYDNAVAETTYKTIKTEFVRGRTFKSLEQLDVELFDYINCYNNHRLHGGINYKRPADLR